jgi:hypothetical protein
MRFGYGGFWLGYLHKSNKPVHFNFTTRLGWGSIYFDQNWRNRNEFNYEPNPDFIDNVFVFIPQLEVEFNFFKWMKINVGAGYRVVAGVDKTYFGEKLFEQKDFNKPQASITLCFGYFK